MMTFQEFVESMTYEKLDNYARIRSARHAFIAIARKKKLEIPDDLIDENLDALVSGRMQLSELAYLVDGELVLAE